MTTSSWRWVRRASFVALSLVILAACSSGSPSAVDSGCDSSTPSAGRVDVQPSGNRLHPGSLDLASATFFDVALEGIPEWVVPDPAVVGGWYIAFEDDSAVSVGPNGSLRPAPFVGEPPVVSSDGPVDPFLDHDAFEDPLPDGRVVGLSVQAVLAGPTDLLRHGVLGDAIEASAIEWVDSCAGTRGRIDIAPPDVIEGTSPILADLDEDGEDEIIVTLSNSTDGARLAAYEFDGSLLATSAPIGRGNRWRNQLAVGPFGVDGATEVVDVRTPHIGGTVQAFQLVDTESGPTLERTAASGARYTTHVIRSRNLDMGLGIDANLDGRPDVVVATSDLQFLVALTRSNESQGWEILTELEVGGTLSTNVAAAEGDGVTLLAAGSEGRLRVWRNR